MESGEGCRLFDILAADTLELVGDLTLTTSPTLGFWQVSLLIFKDYWNHECASGAMLEAQKLLTLEGFSGIEGLVRKENCFRGYVISMLEKQGFVWNGCMNDEDLYTKSLVPSFKKDVSL